MADTSKLLPGAQRAHQDETMPEISGSAAKRTCLDSIRPGVGTSVVSTESDPFYHDAVAQMDEQTVRDLLTAVVYATPDGKQMVLDAWKQHIERERQRVESERARVRDLSHYSGSAWYVLNKKYKSSKGSVEYNNAFTAVSEVNDYIDAIRKEADLDASYGTKKSGLETLRKIGKSILLAPSTLGSEVRKHMQSDAALPNAMLSILNTMTGRECDQLAESSDQKGTFFDKVVELADTAKGYCLFDELDVVLDLLGTEGGEEGEDDAGEDGSSEVEGDG